MSIVTDTDLRARLAGVADIGATGLTVHDEAAVRGPLMDDLVFEAVFNEDAALRDAARWVIWSASQALGAGSASIHELYRARGRGEVPATAFTVPAINVRAAAYLTARQAFAAALERDAGTVIFEIAKSEMAYTDQRPAEYSAVILAAALREGWRAPVFLQGDHFQFNATKWAADPGAEMVGLRDLTREAIGGGFWNIDIDSSTLVDLSQPSVADQQRVNAENTAELTRFIRSLQPDGVTISVGGEIGEVGKENSNEAELRAYLDGYRRELEGRAKGATGLSKVSVQTGTSHGGVPLPGGGVAQVKLEFDVLKRLGEVARKEYGLAGAVQHGASTLPDELFHRFPAVETAEIHLATGFQNLLYEHPAFPKDLLKRIEAWCQENAADERKPGQTEEQFVYTTRKKAIGPFKRELWDLETKDEILAAQRRKVAFLFTELAVNGSRDLVELYIQPVELHRPLPDALRSAVAAR